MIYWYSLVVSNLCMRYLLRIQLYYIILYTYHIIMYIHISNINNWGLRLCISYARAYREVQRAFFAVVRDNIVCLSPPSSYSSCTKFFICRPQILRFLADKNLTKKVSSHVAPLFLFHSFLLPTPELTQQPHCHILFSLHLQLGRISYHHIIYITTIKFIPHVNLN